MISPGSAVNFRSATAGALAVVGERHVAELDQAADAAGIDGVRPVAHRRHRVGDLEELDEPRAVLEQAVGEADGLLEPDDQHAGEAREGDDLADRREPVDVEPDADDEDRKHRERRRGAGQHGADRPPRQHRHLRAEQLADDAAQPAHFGLDARIALHQRDIAERVGRALGQVAVVAFDRALAGFGLAQHQRGEPCEHQAEHDQQQRQPPVQKERQRQQHQERNERRQMLAEKSKPQPPQRIRAGEHDLHQPAGMDAAMEAERQLQDVLEIVRHHRVTAAVRQPVGVQRHQRAAGDGEQAEAHPGREQRYEVGPDRATAASLGAGQCIDDAPEQDGFGKLRRGQRNVGDGQRPAELRFVAQELEHARVEVDEIHDALVSAGLCPCGLMDLRIDSGLGCGTRNNAVI